MKMSLTKGQEAHPGTVWVWRDPTDRWPQFTCSFCGSVKPAVAASWLDKGNDASGSSWKMGWPHKFYVSDDNGLQWKLYSEHLTELDADTFASVTGSIASVLKIRFEYDAADRLFIRAPSFGFQAWRVGGSERVPLPEGAPLQQWEIEQNQEIQGE